MRRTVQEASRYRTGFHARQTRAGVDPAGGAAETGAPCPRRIRLMPYEPPKHCAHCGTALGPVENFPGQLICPPAGCGRITYMSPIPVVAAIVERDGEIVLVRSHGWPESWNGLMPGFLDPNEEPEAAA